MLFLGSATLDTTAYYHNNTADTLQSISFSHTLSNGNLTSYSSVSSLQTLNFDISPSGNINVTTYICGVPSGGLTFCVLSMSLSRLSQLKLRYLVLESTFDKITHFYGSATYYVQNQGTTDYDIANPIINNFGIPAINTATTTRVFTFLNGFNATANNATNAFDIEMTASYPLATVLRVETRPTNN